MEDKERIAEIQNIIKKGCASGLPYPWCQKCDEENGCWYHEAKAIVDAGYTRPAEPSRVARIVSEDGQSGIATGANIPEPNPSSLDEIIPPAEPAEERVEAVAEKIYNALGNPHLTWGTCHVREQYRELAREILKLCRLEEKGV